MIANGGSSNNRNSPDNTYEGIEAFWRESEASSVMIARAAEWNPSVFRKEGKLPIMEARRLFKPCICCQRLSTLNSFAVSPFFFQYRPTVQA